MRKKRRTIIVLAVLLCLAAAFLFRDAGVRLFVRLDRRGLETFAVEALTSADPDVEFTLHRYGLWRVTCWPDAGMVEFHTGGFGIAPSSREKGFYYSANDVPLADSAADTPLTESGNGWTWEYLGNHGETSRILAHWFWFESYF